MFQKIAGGIRFPDWANNDSRYRRLDLRDRLLEGTFYNHLGYAFYDEVETGTEKLIPLADRRPSAQYRLPRMVARWASRKLFAGRHVPKVRHKDPKTAIRINALLRKGKFFAHMKAAAMFGSVGAVAVTFRVDIEGDDNRVALQLWRAKYCQPSFDNMGELAQLRVAYVTNYDALKAMGAPGIEAGQEYWFIKDWLPTGEMQYIPVKKAEWNPVQGFVGEGAASKKLEKWDEATHTLGFLCAQWFVNLPGGQDCDGACTFEDAIPNSIELDYTLSQIGRGTRYNCAPQLVTIGEVTSGSGDVTRSPMTHIGLKAAYKDEDGQTLGQGDAKLLEMSGAGTEAALKLIDHLRNMALEQISASRKDPDKMKAPLSGRAMEYLDQDSDDLVYDLRDQYGEHGALPLIKKIILAAKLDTDASGITLQWPRMFQPTPDEVKALVEAFVAAIDPLKKSAPAQPATPAQPGAEGRPGKPGTPEVPAVVPDESEQILTIQEARAYISQVLDLSMLDLELEEDAEGAEVDDSPTAPDKPTPTAPPPSSIDVTDPQDTPAENPDGPGPTRTEGGMNIGAPVHVDA